MFEIKTVTKYGKQRVVNLGVQNKFSESALAAFSVSLRRMMSLYGERQLTCCSSFKLPHLLRLFLFFNQDLFGLCSNLHLTKQLKFNRTNSVQLAGMFQHRDGAMPRVSQLITSVLSVPHELLLLLLSLSHTHKGTHTHTSQADTLTIKTIFCQPQSFILH